MRGGAPFRFAFTELSPYPCWSINGIELDANTLAALGNKSPEKWEGQAIGPQQANGQYLVLAGTDNDYSVTQNGTGTQLDDWLGFRDADAYASTVDAYVSAVPEPQAWLLMMGGLFAVGAAVKQRR